MCTPNRLTKAQARFSRHNCPVFPTFTGGVTHPPWAAVVRQLGEQLHDLARRADELATENPGWIAPSQVAVAQDLAEAAIFLESQAERVLRQLQ